MRPESGSREKTEDHRPDKEDGKDFSAYMYLSNWTSLYLSWMSCSTSGSVEENCLGKDQLSVDICRILKTSLLFHLDNGALQE